MTLLLFPNLLDNTSNPLELPAVLQTVVPTLDGLIAESERIGRRFLSHFRTDACYVPIALCNHSHTDVAFLLEPLINNKESWGFVSDNGLPCIADPGATLVRAAHIHNIPVIAYSGPSAIIQALLLSGLPAQHFTFHGYLPSTPAVLRHTLAALSLASTHLWIETPFRTVPHLTTLIDALAPTATLSVSIDLGTSHAQTITQTIAGWRKIEPASFAKKRAVFVLKK